MQVTRQGKTHFSPETDEEGESSEQCRVVEIEDDVGPLLRDVDLGGGKREQ